MGTTGGLDISPSSVRPRLIAADDLGYESKWYDHVLNSSPLMLKGNLLLFEDEKFRTISTKQEADVVVDKDHKSLLLNKCFILKNEVFKVIFAP